MEIAASIDVAEIARAPPARIAVDDKASGGRLGIAPNTGRERRAGDENFAGLAGRHFIGRAASGHDHAQVAVKQWLPDTDQPIADHLLGGNATAGGA